MGLQSGRKTATGEHQSLYGSTAGLRDSFAEESTDVLRRRAEHLLDEMMLGAVDAGGDYGGDYGSALHTNGIFVPLDAGEPVPSANGSYAVVNDHSANEAAYRAPGVPAAAETNGNRTAPGAGESAPGGMPYSIPPYASEGADEYQRRTDPPDRPPRLVSAEDRYADAGAREQRSRAEIASPIAGGPVNGAVRRQASSPASMMTVGPRTSLRSNLLPRSTEVDIASAQQEINELLHEVAALLPAGHEATERSRHLLSKAQNILQSDQSRSAEIEYYLQQVRRILERTQQRQTWSDLYRARLMIYLVGWTLLATVILVGLGLYRTGFALLVAELVGTTPDAPWAVYAGMTLATACAGALGATIGVFAGIARRRRTESGYFDRKYGLRGLLMPLLGFVFGAMIAVAASALFFFTGIDPNQSVVILLPLVLAFFVGVGQESLYGAR